LRLGEASILLRAFPVISSKHYQQFVPRSLKMRDIHPSTGILEMNTVPWCRTQ
jgi:hypothetical protein